MTVLITNDDGYKSAGLRVLYRATKAVFKDVVVVAPDKLQSSSGMSFTFHKPLRVDGLTYEGMPCLSVSGTPADCVFMSLNHLFKGKIDLVVSGINTGMNVGLQAVYSSGTVSAAIFSAISNVPSIAFSKCFVKFVDESGTEAQRQMEKVYPHLVNILKKIKQRGFPADVEMLNVNFPVKVTARSKIQVVRTDRRVFEDIVKADMDPHGKTYYWLYGNLRNDFDEQADVAHLLKGDITITPIRLSAVEEENISKVRTLFA